VITVAVATWSVDATSLKGWPATIAEWVDINTKHLLTANGVAAPAPDHLYTFQQASGTIADIGTVGTKTLSIAGTPVYQRAVAGWTRVAIGADGTATTQTASNGTLADISGSSAMAVGLLQYVTQGANRDQLAVGASGVNALEVAGGTNFMRKRDGAVGQNGLISHVGAVHPFVVLLNNEDSLDELFSDLERVSLTYAAQSGTSVIATFNTTAAAGGNTDILGLAVWRGAGARRSPLEIKRLLQAMAWAVSGY
jgi:hypothetical protein